MTPVVFASLAPRFREPRREHRVLSPSDLAIIALLVARGAALEAKTFIDYWAEHLLIEVCPDYDSLEALPLLMEIGADIHFRQLDDFKFNRTLLQAAAGRGAIGAVRFLLDHGVLMNYHNPLEDREAINGTPLHWAAGNAQYEVVQLLLSRGGVSGLEAMDWQGRIPLICAARLLWNCPDPFPSRDLNREGKIRILVDAGADVTAMGRLERSWSFIAGELEYLSDSLLGHVSIWGGGNIIRYLVSRGSDIHQQRSYPKDARFPRGIGALGGNTATLLHAAAHN